MSDARAESGRERGRVDATAGQVGTLIVDVDLHGNDFPVDITEIAHPDCLLRARVYRRANLLNDLWEVDSARVEVVSSRFVQAAGSPGTVRVILSVVQ